MKRFFRTCIVLVGIGVFALFFAAVFYGVFNIGNALGMWAGLMLIGYGFAFEKINVFLNNLRKRKWGMSLLIVGGVAVAVALITITVLSVKMHGAMHNPPDKETTVVVLGCKVHQDGPGILLRERVLTAKKFLEENPEINCVLSGGKGDDEPVSEAECMRQMLIEGGINPERLFVEDKSTSTRENIEFSKKVIEQNGLNPCITVITSDFHQYRAMKIAQSLGLESFSISAKTPFSLFSTYHLREIGGILKGVFIEY